MYPFGCQGQFPPNKWLAALVHWLTAMPCVYDVTGIWIFKVGFLEAISGRPERVHYPKLLIHIAQLTSCFGSSRQPYLFKGSLHHSLTGWYVLHYWLLYRFGYLEVDLGVNIGSFIHCSSVVRVSCSCSFSHWKAMGITTRPSQWQNKVGT